MVKFDGALVFLLSTLTTTLFFYLFIHVILIFFLSAKDVEDNLFDTKNYESTSNRQIAEIKEREATITALLKSIHGTMKKDTKGV
jgi:hypothetical protein